MVDEKTDSEPVSDEEIEEETDIVDASVEKKKPRYPSIGEKLRDGQTDFTTLKRKWEKKQLAKTDEVGQNWTDKNTGEQRSMREKDGTGYGDLMTTNVMPYNVNTDSETFVGRKEESKEEDSETYIQENAKKTMTDLNKITHTHIGDHINFYQNGVQDNGVVAKMNGSFITIFKEDGSFKDVHINDTFFVSDILVDKTWNQMNMEERTDSLLKVKAFSPRFLVKTWEQLPQSLKDVLKSDQEQGAYGNIGGRPNVGISTDTDIDADDDYEGNSHDDIQVDNQFQHDSTTPQTDKDAKKAGDFTFKGVPDYNVNTWGINYTKDTKKHIKEDKE
jgi:hypothetical protein|tara:strand:- start:11751 stop:12746 length:996 start_codon:yes stop_codon:yes gene_type:complete